MDKCELWGCDKEATTGAMMSVPGCKLTEVWVCNMHADMIGTGIKLKEKYRQERYKARGLI